MKNPIIRAMNLDTGMIVRDHEPLVSFDNYFRNKNHEAILQYTNVFETVRQQYGGGWIYDFFAPNRFPNRVIYKWLCEQSQIKSVLDFGCYDGLLVKALCDSGIKAYGYEKMPSDKAYEILGIKNKVNVNRRCEMVLALNIAHEYTFSDLLKEISAHNNGLPDFILIDREISRGRFTQEYFSVDFQLNNNARIILMNGCVNEKSKAELLLIPVQK